MNSPLRPSHTIAASLAALLVLTINPAAAAALIAVAGTAAILAADYGRKIGHQPVLAEVVAFSATPAASGVRAAA